MEEFGGFFEAQLLQVGLEAEAVMLAEKAREIAGAGERNRLRNFGQPERAVQAEGKVRGGALQRIAFCFSGGFGFFGEAKPDGLDVTAGGIFGGCGIAEGDRCDEVLVLVGEHAGVGEVVIKALLVKGEEAVPDGEPSVAKQGHTGEFDDTFVKFEVRMTKGAIIADAHGF